MRVAYEPFEHGKFRTRWAGWIALGCAVAALAGCGAKQPATGGAAPGTPPGIGDPGGAVPVTVAKVGLGTMEQTVEVTGNLAALEDVQVSAKTTGRVVSVAAREGDRVYKGEVLVQQYNGDLEANVQAARSDVVSNEAKLQQAYINYKIGVIQAQQNVLQSTAEVAQARETYLKTQRGSRPEEILEAQDTLDSADANMKNARITLDRDTALYKEGAIAESDFDQAQTTYDVDTAQDNDAKEALTLAQIGNREEDIASSAANVRQQETSLRNNIANLKTVQLRSDDIVAAQAALVNSKATLEYNEEQLNYAQITSPIDGVVATRSTEPGQEATPGTVLMRIVNLKTVYYEPTVSETDVARIHVGQSVAVRMDAIDADTFHGVVTDIFPEAAANERTFNLRVTMENPDEVLRPGMFARGAVVTAVHRDVPVVPASALVPDASGGGFTPNASSDEPISNDGLAPPEHVVVVENGKAVIRHVRVGIANMDNAEIASGLSAGDTIVVVGQDTLHEGDPVAVVNPDADESSRVSQALSGGTQAE